LAQYSYLPWHQLPKYRICYTIVIPLDLILWSFEVINLMAVVDDLVYKDVPLGFPIDVL